MSVLKALRRSRVFSGTIGGFSGLFSNVFQEGLRECQEVSIMFQGVSGGLWAAMGISERFRTCQKRFKGYPEGYPEDSKASVAFQGFSWTF